MQDTEKFYPLKGFEEHYEITKSARLRRLPYTIKRINKKGELYFTNKPNNDIKGFINQAGYRVVGIFIKDIYNKRHGIHRLVANTFLDNPENLPLVNHKDGNPLNNHVDNLEFCTSSYNNQHRYDVLGYISKNRRLSDEDIIFIYENAIKCKNKYDKSGNFKFLSEKYNVNVCTINEIVNNKTYLNITKHLKRKEL